MQEILSRTYFNNTVQDYLIVLGGILTRNGATATVQKNNPYTFKKMV